jgi:hypothetical protein
MSTKGEFGEEVKGEEEGEERPPPRQQQQQSQQKTLDSAEGNNNEADPLSLATTTTMTSISQRLSPSPLSSSKPSSSAAAVDGAADAVYTGSPLPPLPYSDDNDVYDDDGHDDRDPLNQTVLDEEMHRKLMDVESSFLAEASTVGVGVAGMTGADDTYLVGMNTEEEQRRYRVAVDEEEKEGREREDTPTSSPTPPGAYKTPASPQSASLQPSVFEDTERLRDLEAALSGASLGADDTSSLQPISSSPTATAAAGTLSRVLSTAPLGAGHAPEELSQSETDGDLEATPRRNPSHLRNISPERSVSRWSAGVASGEGGNTERRRKRPKFLTSRQSVHRFSSSSIATDTTSSDAAQGVDYALQSGGAAPANNSHTSHLYGKSKLELSRSTSLGSLASGISGVSDDNLLDRRAFSGVTDPSLDTLDEEEAGSQTRPDSPNKTPKRSDTAPMTPKAKAYDPAFPPDTVIADRIQDIQIPGTFARQFRENYLGLSPDKRGGTATPGFGRSGKTMTLKEQSSTIDRLSKENFDLKMRIHFLTEALNKRSEEGIKEMISENVELKSNKLKLQKDNLALRRTIRDLEKQLRDQGDMDKEGLLANKEESGAGSGEEGGSPVDEEELLYLRERIETYEVEIERLREESIAREGEKRRLAEMVKSLVDERGLVGSDVGAREERVSSFMHICLIPSLITVHYGLLLRLDFLRILSSCFLFYSLLPTVKYELMLTCLWGV